MQGHRQHLCTLALRVSVFVVATCWCGFPKEVGASTNFTDADGTNSEVDNALNWDSGVPSNANAGTVPTGLNVTYNDDSDLDSATITFEGNSTLTGPASKIENATLTFQDSSSYTSTLAIAIGRDQVAEGAPLGDTTLNIQGTASVIAGGDIKIARGQNAFVNQTGGSLSTGTGAGGGADDDGLELGVQTKGGVGMYTLSGGSVSASGGTGIELQNQSLFTISGGNVTATKIAVTDKNGVPGGSFDFTLGSTGALTVINGGADYTSDFQTFISDGKITLGGEAAQISDFDFSYVVGAKTTLSLPGIGLQPLRLIVNTSTGEVTLSNPNGTPVAIDYYEIRSAAGDLIAGFDADFEPDGDVDSIDLATWEGAYGVDGDGDADNNGDSNGIDFLIWQQEFGSSAATSGWVSLEDQDHEGNGAPGTGNGWEEGENVSDMLLFETFLTDSSEINNGADISLGNLFTLGGSPTLSFEYHVAGEGDVYPVGDVSYVSSQGAVQAVPEPSTVVLFPATIYGLALALARSNPRVVYPGRLTFS